MNVNAPTVRYGVVMAILASIAGLEVLTAPFLAPPSYADHDIRLGTVFASVLSITLSVVISIYHNTNRRGRIRYGMLGVIACMGTACLFATPTGTTMPNSAHLTVLFGVLAGVAATCGALTAELLHRPQRYAFTTVY